jgi:hypothetical protein
LIYCTIGLNLLQNHEKTWISRAFTFIFTLAIPAQGGGKAAGSRKSSTIKEPKPNFLKNRQRWRFFYLYRLFEPPYML